MSFFYSLSSSGAKDELNPEEMFSPRKIEKKSKQNPINQSNRASIGPIISDVWTKVFEFNTNMDLIKNICLVNKKMKGVVIIEWKRRCKNITTLMTQISIKPVPPLTDDRFGCLFNEDIFFSKKEGEFESIEGEKTADFKIFPQRKVRVRSDFENNYNFIIRSKSREESEDLVFEGFYSYKVLKNDLKTDDKILIKWGVMFLNKNLPTKKKN